MRRKKFLVNFVHEKIKKGVNNNPHFFLFFDTETKQKTEVKKIGKKEYKTVINTLDFGWACLWDIETDKEYWRYFSSIIEFEKIISNAIRISKKSELWIVAHNIVFDNIITDIWEILKKKKYESNFIHSKGMVFLQKLIKYRNVRNDKTGEVERKKDKAIMLVNNGNIFPAPLKVIGETIGLKKLDMEFGEDNKKYTREQFIEYGQRDVEILLKFWREWIKFITGNDLGSIKYTISSQSMEAFKHKFCKDFIVLDDNIEVLDFERKGYYGGRTEIFHKGIVKNHIYYYDVNSMYPHVMKNFRYPTQYKFTKENPSLFKVEDLIKEGWLVMAECYIETENNCYPVKEDNTLLFPIGKFKTYLPTPEVIEGLKNGDIKKFGRVQFYHGEQIFENYVEFFYNKRLEMKAQKNKQEQMYKLFLNSLYGKFGQMMDKWAKADIEEIKAFDINFDLDLWIMDEYKIPNIITALGEVVTPKIRYIGGELQMAGEMEESNISFPAISAHVTSYARLIIWEAIKYCKMHNIKYYYCDTDSIFTNEEMPKEIVDNKELGKFKIEKEYHHGVEFINLKNYCALNENYEKEIQNEKNEFISIDSIKIPKESKTTFIKGTKWKMKGVPNNAEIIDENNFITQEWGGLPKQEYYKKFGRKAGEFWVIYKEKQNHNVIKKGITTSTGDIKPFKLNSW
jgi:hypothetical protein